MALKSHKCMLEPLFTLLLYPLPQKINKQNNECNNNPCKYYWVQNNYFYFSRNLINILFFYLLNNVKNTFHHFVAVGYNFTDKNIEYILSFVV